MSAKERHTRPILGGDIECPTCGVKPGQHCQSKNGLQIGGLSHSARYQINRNLQCINCGQQIRDGSSGSGLVHVSGFCRCDGKPIRAAGANKATRAEL